MAEGFDERLFGPVDGDVLELEMLLRPGPAAADAQGDQEEDNSFHSGVVLVICKQK